MFQISNKGQYLYPIQAKVIRQTFVISVRTKKYLLEVMVKSVDFNLKLGNYFP